MAWYVVRDAATFSGESELEVGGIGGKMWTVERTLPLPAELVRPCRLLHSRWVLLLECSAISPPVRHQQYSS